eukprot:gene8371-5860_t
MRLRNFQMELDSEQQQQQQTETVPIPPPQTLSSPFFPLVPHIVVICPSDDRVLQNYIVVPRSPKSKWSINDFDLLHRLGGGNYGEVYLASVKNCNFICAIKQIPIKKLTDHDIIHQLRREVEIAFNSRHKYLLRTFGYFYDRTDFYFILEACGNGMLYSELSRVKICGTPEYFPPEIVHRQPYDCSADLWCLGVFCYELLVGRTPFYNKENEQIYKKIHAGKYTIPDTVVPEAADLITNLLHKDRSKRLPLKAVLSHPFLMNYYYTPNRLSPPTGKRPREELFDTYLYTLTHFTISPKEKQNKDPPKKRRKVAQECRSSFITATPRLLR